MINLGKWTLNGFRLEIGRHEIAWRGRRRSSISRKNPIRIGSTLYYSRGPFAIFLKEKSR